MEFSHNRQHSHATSPANMVISASGGRFLRNDSSSSLPSFFRSANRSKPVLRHEVRVLTMPGPPSCSGLSSAQVAAKLTVRQTMLIFIGVLVSPSAKKARARMLTVRSEEHTSE